LDNILRTNLAAPDNKKLLVGNSSKDDAAVYDLGNGTALVTTTDFFMPIVDDAFSFGKIAGANAISDVYAMGGQPIVAIAILGWPVDKIPASVAARKSTVCTSAYGPNADIMSFKGLMQLHPHRGSLHNRQTKIPRA